MSTPRPTQEPPSGSAGRRWARTVLAWRRRLAAKGPRWLAAQATLTLLTLSAVLLVAIPAVRWAFYSAEWGVVAANLKLYMVGQYPVNAAGGQLGIGLLGHEIAAVSRPSVTLIAVALLVGVTSGAHPKVGIGLARFVLASLVTVLAVPVLGAAVQGVFPSNLDDLALAFARGRGPATLSILALAAGWAAGRSRWWRDKLPARLLTVAWVLSPVVVAVLLSGEAVTADVAAGGFALRIPGTGLRLSIPEIQASVPMFSPFGGVLLTLILAATSIALSFVIGVLLALGRRSQLPLVKGLCVAYIELIRGVPLVTVLFMALVMAPLVLPPGPWLERAFRAMVGFTLFSAAYIAEDVRGGLAAVGRGQFDAAHALGLGTVGTYRLVVLPQALRIVIPALVGQFISLFKDTALVGILGLNELLGIALVVVGQPRWLGLYRESLVFVAVIYLIVSQTMAHTSRQLEAARP